MSADNLHSVKCPGGLPDHLCWTPDCQVKEDGTGCSLAGEPPLAGVSTPPVK